jgi:truncated hemoglobin YjbI
MSTGFTHTPKGIAIRLDVGEVSILTSLVSQILGLVEPGVTGDDPLERALGVGPARKSDDPVLARLFPSAYEGDDEAAGEFRRYTEATLRDGKRADAETLLDTAGPGDLLLTPEQAQAWLRALNDVRLALGVRMEVTEEIHDEIEAMAEDDPRYPALVTYEWLTYLQDTLVRALW